MSDLIVVRDNTGWGGQERSACGANLEVLTNRAASAEGVIPKISLLYEGLVKGQ